MYPYPGHLLELLPTLLNSSLLQQVRPPWVPFQRQPFQVKLLGLLIPIIYISAGKIEAGFGIRVCGRGRLGGAGAGREGGMHSITTRTGIDAIWSDLDKASSSCERNVTNMFVSSLNDPQLFFENVCA